MKQSIILLSILSIVIVSFKSIPPELRSTKTDASTGRMAQQVVAALQHRSLEEYALLFPTLAEVYKLMKINSDFYNGNLEAAKEDFKMHYVHEALPALNQSFKSLLAQGMNAGIDWENIKLVRAEINEEHPSAAEAVIVIRSHGKEYRLLFEKTMMIDGERKISQYLRLI